MTQCRACAYRAASVALARRQCADAVRRLGRGRVWTITRKRREELARRATGWRAPITCRCGATY